MFEESLLRKSYDNYFHYQYTTDTGKYAKKDPTWVGCCQLSPFELVPNRYPVSEKISNLIISIKLSPTGLIPPFILFSEFLYLFNTAYMIQ